MINDVMYSALYPSSKQAKVLDASDLTMLCALIPLRFDFNVVDGNVLAFLDQFRNNVEAAFVGYDDKNSIQKSFFYQYDCLLYRAEISVVPTMYKGYLNHSYNMRFSNDGFLYLPDSVHGVDRTGIERHHGSNWSRLQHAQIRKLPVVTDFAEQLLGSGYGTMFFIHLNFKEWMSNLCRNEEIVVSHFRLSLDIQLKTLSKIIGLNR
jgi:hypothetical protein